MGYYSDIIGTKTYGNTITEQIAKINDAHNVIRSKAISLGLKVSDEALAEDAVLLTTAQAIDNIVDSTGSAKTLNASGSYTVPVGYNKIAYTVTANSLASQTSANATAANILSGLTAWVNGSKITGTLANKTGNQTASGKGYFTSDKKNYLYLTIPATGKYEGSKQLQSNIPYFNASTVELPITISTTANNETVVDSSKATFPAGYYSGQINISAVLDAASGSTNKVLNISNAVGATLSSQSGSLTIPSGYDYLSPTATYTIKLGSVSAVTRSVNASTGVVTFGGGTTTAGWVSSNVTKPETYTPAAATFNSVDASGKTTVKTAGWVTAGTAIGGLGAGSVTFGNPVKNGSTATTIDGVSIPANSHYIQVTKGAGYITAGTVTKNLGTVSVSTATSSSSSTGTSITSQKWLVVTSAGYNPSAITTVLSVRNGSINAVTSSVDSATGVVTFGGGTVATSGWVSSNVTIPSKYTPTAAVLSKNGTTGAATVTTAGWITKDTVVGGLSAGSAVMSGPSSGKVTLTTTAGYITAGTQTLDLGVAALSSGSLSSAVDGATTITSKYWKATVSKGYTAGSTVNFTVQSGSASISGAKQSDNSYKVTLTKTAGWIGAGSDSHSISAATMSSASLSSAASGATTISNRYWKASIGAGYTPGQTINFTVKAGSVGNAVTINSSTGACTIPISTSGWVNSGTVTLNTVLKSNSYTINSTDMADTDSKIAIQPASGTTAMTSLTLDMSNITNALAAI